MSDLMEGVGTPPRRKPRKLQKRSGRGSVEESATMSPRSLHEDDRSEERNRLFERRDSDLTDLPVDDHSFLDDNSVQEEPDAPDGGDSVAEREMRRHFMDVESSFLPDGGHASTIEGRKGADDTYLELGQAERTPSTDQMFGSVRRSKQGSYRGLEQQQERGSDDEPETPADAYKTPAPGRGYEEDIEEESQEDVDGAASPSSPAQAAARRGHARNVSTASLTRSTPVRLTSISVRSNGTSRPASPVRPTSKGSTIRPGSADPPEDVPLPKSAAASMLSSNGVHSSSPARLGARPSYLSSRHPSQQSSVSTSTLTSLSSTDTAVNADFALQTGGAMSSSNSLGPTHGRAELLRLPSFGSVVSYMDRDSDNVPAYGRGASSNNFASRFGGRLDGLEEERPETPRASNSSIQPPTDTVLAQRVESIQVPETVARDFRARNRSPVRPSSSSGNGVGTQDRP
ncbi:hypothetical protein LTR53_009023, partial [Teratosphaeriaceae sp. CCFEE 6253]